MTINKIRNSLKKNIQGKRGITLIELLIVVGIVAIVSLAIIPSYMDFAQKKDFNNKVEVIVTELMEVRNKALSGAVIINGSGNRVDVNWGFQPASGCVLRRYFLGYADDQGNFTAQDTLDLPENVTFGTGASPTPCDTIIFQRLKGTPLFTVSGDANFQEIILKYGSQTRTITVNSSGRISYN